MRSQRPKKGGKPATVVAFAHYQGGTGKTTSCLNIAGWLVKLKKRTLIVDLDPRGTATAGLGADREAALPTINDVLNGKKQLSDVILKTAPGIHLAPSSLEILATERKMARQVNKIFTLKRNLAEVLPDYDYIFIDLPPGSTFLMLNGIVAAGNLIIPMDPGVFAHETMEALSRLLSRVRDELGVEIRVMMVLLKECSPTAFDIRHTRSIRAMLNDFVSEIHLPGVEIYKVPFSTAVFKSRIKGEPLSHCAPKSSAGRVYKEIAEEIIHS